jgi:hypothetical protein
LQGSFAPLARNFVVRNINASNAYKMGHQSDDMLSEQQRKRWQFIDERIDLLEVIREMVDAEIDRRIGSAKRKRSKRKRKQPFFLSSRSVHKRSGARGNH